MSHLDPELVRARKRAVGNSPVRLTSNENRMGLPPEVRAALLDAFSDSHIYPDDSSLHLTRALARRHGVEPDAIVHSHGSTDLLRMVVSAHALEARLLRIALAEPTFEHLVEYARPFRPQLFRLPLTSKGWAHDLPGMEEALATEEGPALIYICNPNNPTGTLTPSAQIEEWIRRAPKDHLFVVDEAYFEYVEDPSHRSLDQWAGERPNVVVLRTFSKVYGMAGVRVGYAVAHPDTAARLRWFRSERGANHLGNMGALAALAHPEIISRALAANRASKNVVYGVLDELGLEYMESHTNFVMHQVNGPAERYVERMEEAGFLVGRPFPSFPTHNRISLGTPAEMRSWAEALRQFRREGWV